MVAALGLAAVSLSGAIMEYISWPLGGSVSALSAVAAVWLRRRAAQESVKPPVQKVEGGLRIVEKPLPAGKPRLPHGLRLTISTEVSVALGLRVVCSVPIPEFEALAQTGRGSSARQGVPAAVRESRQAWLFVVRNSPGQRELFLRVDLFAAQPFQVERVDQVRAGVAVVLPEWKELEPIGQGTAPEVPPTEPSAQAAEPPAPASEPAAQAAEPAASVGDPGGPAGNASPPAPASPPASAAEPSS
jgi:hypothetical protein